MFVSFFKRIYAQLCHQLLQLKRPFKKRGFTQKARLGKKGEEAAAVYLAYHKGFKILGRNWRYGSDELDLIAQDRHGMLVFIEVRLRSGGTLEAVYNSITLHKKRALKRACLAYLRNLTKLPTSYRFDVIVIQVSGLSTYNFYHFENIPLFSLSPRPVKNPYA